MQKLAMKAGVYCNIAVLHVPFDQVKVSEKNAAENTQSMIKYW